MHLLDHGEERRFILVRVIVVLHLPRALDRELVRGKESNYTYEPAYPPGNATESALSIPCRESCLPYPS